MDASRPGAFGAAKPSNEPENVTRLRRFAVGVLNLVGGAKTSIAEKMAKLNRNTRLVFDYLRMTKNTTRQAVI